MFSWVLTLDLMTAFHACRRLLSSMNLPHPLFAPQDRLCRKLPHLVSSPISGILLCVRRLSPGLLVSDLLKTRPIVCTHLFPIQCTSRCKLLSSGRAPCDTTTLSTLTGQDSIACRSLSCEPRFVGRAKTSADQGRPLFPARFFFFFFFWFSSPSSILACPP